MTVIEYLRSRETKESVIRFIQEHSVLYQGIDAVGKIQDLTGLLYNQFVTECVQNNQYISLSNETINQINRIYRDLIVELRMVCRPDVSRSELEPIVVGHRKRLIHVLRTNTYNEERKQIYIPCAEYSGSFQQHILRLQDMMLAEPVIDIGCGKSHELVNLLRYRGFRNVYGIDQYTCGDPQIICCNWFEYRFREDTFGTVLAHMSFSNHYRRSIISNESRTLVYWEKFSEILASLVRGGKFVYTPALREVEGQLDSKKYRITYYRNTPDENLDTVCIERL